MPSGYELAGADLDGILAPFHSGWPQAAAVGYAVAGANLNARYAPLSTGSAPAATGFKQAGADLSTIFAALGSTGVQVGTQPANVTGTSAAGHPSGVVTSGSASCAGSKGGGSYTYTWHTTGCTATSPSSPSTTFFATVNAATTDHATAFCTISDGVTSINTSTISVTLQNTSTPEDDLVMFTGTVANEIGFENGAIGTMTPGTLGDGSIVQQLAIADHLAPTPRNMLFSISNYPGTITQSYLTSLTLLGGTFAPGDANFLGFSGGAPGSSATWNWANGPIPGVGVSVPVAIIRT